MVQSSIPTLLALLVALLTTAVSAVFPQSHSLETRLHHWMDAEVVLWGRIAYHWSDLDPSDGLFFGIALEVA